MFTLNCKGKLLLINKPLVMGILNVTPDSFYTGSRSSNTDDLLEKAEQMVADGADILDIGGQSTRPGSTLITDEEELKRVIVSVEALHHRFPEVVISVDTFYSRVASEAVGAGASIVNDISGGQLDASMFATVAGLRVPYILTHMRGTPATMQGLAEYDSVMIELTDYFIQKLADLRLAGINDIIIDPGFGFAKNSEHNFRLLRHLEILSILQCPVMIGLSRKGTIYNTLKIDPSQSLNGTTVLHTIALMNGAGILRVHDVKQAREAVTLYTAYRSANDMEPF